MRHDAYSSAWRRVAFASILLFLTGLIVWGMKGIERTTDQSPQPTSQATEVASPTTTPSETDIRSSTDPALLSAVYSFVEAYNLPTSDHRNELLEKLSTTEGYAMVYRSTDDRSTTEQAAGDVSIAVVRDDASVQIEPFDDDSGAVSVYAEPTIRVIRDGTIIRTVRLPALITSWVKESNGWKFAYIQP